MARSITKSGVSVDDWLTDDGLLLLESWARDGYTFQDIANRIGIAVSTLRGWRAQYPEFDEALKRGREIIDYKVENALLKSALGYKTKEVKVTTTMRYGKVVETVKEVTDREQAPNVSAIQCWLYNRLPNKWKKNRDNLIELDEEDTKIQVTVTRASQSTKPNAQHDDTVDEEWQDEVNQSIEIRSMTEEEQAEAVKKKAKAKSESSQKLSTKVESEANDEDLDYWPDDWEDEDEEWED